MERVDIPGKVFQQLKASCLAPGLPGKMLRGRAAQGACRAALGDPLLCARAAHDVRTFQYHPFPGRRGLETYGALHFLCKKKCTWGLG